MVIDDGHILETEIVPMKRMMTDFLRALSPDDDVAIVYVGRSDLGQDFTRDVGKLRSRACCFTRCAHVCHIHTATDGPDGSIEISRRTPPAHSFAFLANRELDERGPWPGSGLGERQDAAGLYHWLLN
jgi:hypothetical protein